MREGQDLNKNLGYLWLHSMHIHRERLRSHRLTSVWGEAREDSWFALQINALIVNSMQSQRAEKPHEKLSAVDPMSFFYLLILCRRFLEEREGRNNSLNKYIYGWAKQEQRKSVIRFCEQIWYDLMWLHVTEGWSRNSSNSLQRKFSWAAPAVTEVSMGCTWPVWVFTHLAALVCSR